MQAIEKENQKRATPTYLSPESKDKINQFASEYCKVSGTRTLTREAATNLFVQFAGNSAIENVKKAFNSINNN